jgi:hypothetical protein
MKRAQKKRNAVEEDSVIIHLTSTSTVHPLQEKALFAEAGEPILRITLQLEE